MRIRRLLPRLARSTGRGRLTLAVVLVGLVAGLLALAPARRAEAGVDVVTSSLKASDGVEYWVRNHLVRVDGRNLAAAGAGPAPVAGSTGHEYLLVWAGDANVADTKGSDVQQEHLSVNPVKVL